MNPGGIYLWPTTLPLRQWRRSAITQNCISKIIIIIIIIIIIVVVVVVIVSDGCGVVFFVVRLKIFHHT